MNLPHHLGIILDGNRRWAKERGLPAFEGHKVGLKRVKKIIQYCSDKGIKALSLFVFSTENWKRPKAEVSYLMRLAKSAITDYLKELNQKGVRIRVIGQRDKLSNGFKKQILAAECLTKNNQGMLLNFALSYGGRTEIIEAVKNIIKKGIKPEKVNEKLISDNLWASDLDLIIRTGKEQRISNFLIWQAAYSELYFSPKFWPDFTERELDAALADYASRSRRFGK